MKRLALLLCAACGGSGAGPDAAPERPPWSPRLPAAAEAFGERRGLVAARGIIHLHSVYSHDACDGEPREDETGPIDEACLADLRAALCATRVDFAALSDHDATMADEDFETLLLAGPTDEVLTDADDAPVAARLACEDEHTVLAMVGSENPLMPIMLDRHVDGTVAERHDIYNAETTAAATAMREAGALVWIPHTEQRSIELLRELAPDGIEIYNLHANIDPDIRSEHLGLPAGDAISAVAEFADTNLEHLEPDLAIISFLEPSGPALERWHELLGDGRRVPGSAGTDAHQNALPIEMSDGERGDSYRRMLRWFSNVALVPGPDGSSDPAAIERAVAAGRSFVAFEIFGTPGDFDVVATGAGDPVELGGEVSAAAGATLEVALPEVHGLDPELPAPEIRARILRVAPGGAVTEVDAGDGATLSAPLDAPGAWRVEVLITPHHLAPYLEGLQTDHSDREYVWIYANPIYVTE